MLSALGYRVGTGLRDLYLAHHVRHYSRELRAVAYTQVGGGTGRRDWEARGDLHTCTTVTMDHAVVQRAVVRGAALSPAVVRRAVVWWAGAGTSGAGASGVAGSGEAPATAAAGAAGGAGRGGSTSGGTGGGVEWHEDCGRMGAGGAVRVATCAAMANMRSLLGTAFVVPVGLEGEGEGDAAGGRRTKLNGAQ